MYALNLSVKGLVNCSVIGQAPTKFSLLRESSSKSENYPLIVFIELITIDYQILFFFSLL